MRFGPGMGAVGAGIVAKSRSRKLRRRSRSGGSLKGVARAVKKVAGAASKIRKKAKAKRAVSSLKKKMATRTSSTPKRKLASKYGAALRRRKRLTKRS